MAQPLTSTSAQPSEAPEHGGDSSEIPTLSEEGREALEAWRRAHGSEAFIGRQPIFNRSQRVVGYEILFRAGDVDTAQVVDAQMATATVMMNALTEIGLERIVGPHLAWINISRESLLSGIPKILPPSVAGYEILEDQLVDDELVEAVRELKQLGYKISLDDFHFSPEYEPLLALADVVKLDHMTLGEQDFARHVELLKPYPVSVLAEKVEDKAAHEFCRSLGCDLFQGFFYRAPDVVSERRIELTSGSILQVLSALQRPGLEFDELEPLIAHDLPLSLRLLRYINSAFFGLRQEVTSIKRALVLLGLENVRRWATLTIMSSIEGKSPELTTAALVRAKFCELAGSAGGMDGASLFTLGLFSLIDAMLDVALEQVVAELPFPNEMRVALLRHAGPMGAVLDAAIALEEGYFGDARLLVPDAGKLYTEALLWAHEATQALYE